MLTLAINTASSQIGIALFENLNLLAEDFWPAKNDEAEKLMPAIERLIKSSIKKLSTSHPIYDFEKIYIVKGPGSFTGLRVGVTVANTLAYLKHCSLFGLSTFEFWHSVTSLPILIYAGSGGVYLSHNSKSEHELIKLSELNEKLHEEKITEVTGDITPEQESVLKNAKFSRLNLSFGEIMRTIIKKHEQNELPDLKSVKIIQPLYVKGPHISVSKKLSISTGPA